MYVPTYVHLGPIPRMENPFVNIFCSWSKKIEKWRVQIRLWNLKLTSRNC
jgi:hypothetical protein